MKILVCGGRDFSDEKFLFKVLSAVHNKTPITEIIHGAAKGADTLASQWAKRHGIPEKSFPAQWKKYGLRAGFERNIQMLLESKPDKIIAFPGGTETANMIALGEKAKIFVELVVQI